MKHIVALGLVLAAVGCAKEKEEPKVKAPSSLFEEADLLAGATLQLTAAEIGNAVSSAFKSLAPDESESAALTLDEEDPGDACAKKKRGELRYTADKANAIVNETIDVKECGFLDTMAGTKLTYSVAEAKVLGWFGCRNDDIEDLDGVTVDSTQGELPAFAYCKSEEDVQVLSNLSLNLEASGFRDDGAVISAKVKVIQAFQTIDGAPCSASYADGNWTWSDGCLVVQRFVFPSAESYASATYTGVVESHDPQPWFEAGAFDLKLNNWTGKLRFSGGNTPPTWDMTDGSTTKSGTVNEFAFADGPLANKVRKYAFKTK